MGTKPFRISLWAMAALVLCAGTTFAAEIRGSSTTIPYYWSESITDEEFNHLALYEFAQFGAYNVGTPGLDFYFSGWGRYDTMDAMDIDEESAGDGELGSAYLRWRQEEGLIDLSLGRSFVAQGPVFLRMDGLQTQFEPVQGFGLQMFGGIPVISVVGERNGDFGYGGRLYGGWRNYLEIGLSGASFTEKNDAHRVPLGVDLTVLPTPYLDLLGHWYYDALFESNYDIEGTLVVRPVTDLKILGQYQQLMPSALLGMGTYFSVFSFENIRKINSEARYTIVNRVVISGEFDHYIYDEIDPANRYGGTAGVLWGEARNNTFDVGAFRLDRDDNGYMEYRAYFIQNVGKIFYTTLDGIFYQLDEKLYEEDQGFNGAGSIGFHVVKGLDIQATGFYAVSPYYEQDVRGLLKIAYNYDRVFGEGGMQ